MEEESISDHKLNKIKSKKRKRIQGTIISKIKKNLDNDRLIFGRIKDAKEMMSY